MKKLMDSEDTDNTKIINKMHAQIERCKIDLQKDPSNPELHVRLGDIYIKWHLDIYNAGQYVDEAITEYQRALESYINSAEIYFKIGQAQYFKGDLDKAINYLNTAINKNPKLGIVMVSHCKAVAFLNKAIKYDCWNKERTKKQ